ncbi:DUF2863 family protein [Zoogloea sp.]|jgi:hypothetical protein|uniref:DUF2863 family protein n=2 Tax=Zoogloea sp. TaxID=49181 RepID=UPI001B7A2EF7|nr:DUF2863 family protein [Zoogloea sp.]HOY01723.1 DUF2863 family protein [Zoogloea sp.]
MKRNRLGRRGGLPRDAEHLLWLANGLADSSSRAEDHFWDQRLADAVDGLLRSEDEEALTTALDHLSSATSSVHAYDELADMIESRAEGALKSDDQHDVLLITAPVMAWSRYRIPAAPISGAVMANLRVHLKAHVLATGVKLALADFLFSPDQLPQGYCATADFATHLGKAAETDTDLHIKTDNLPETAQFLSDNRYLLGAVVVPKGAPIFRWQEEDCSRDLALEQWRAQGGACVAPLLTGCAFEVVLPNAYFAASREADKASRPYSIQASVAFLSTTLDTPAAGVRAVVAPFFERQVEEFRIGFTLSGQSEVVHGVVWPLLGAEDESSETLGQIEATLQACGITDILILDNEFPMEYCDDCGAPMYPSPEGEAVHAELPEEQAEQMPKHLH